MKCIELGRIPKTLIIGPNAVQENWKREILMHTYIEEKEIQVIDGCTKPNGKVLKNATKKLRIEQASRTDKSIFIATTATVKHLKKRDKKGKLLDHSDKAWYHITKLGIEFLIIDESHNFKDPKGSRVKGIHELVLQPQLKYRFILTGSPILNDALDLWSQFYILHPNILGKNFYEFRARYFYDVNAGMPTHVHFPKWVPKDDEYFSKVGGDRKKESLDYLANTIYKYANRVMKDDVLDLPERVYETFSTGMDAKHRKIYEDFRTNLVTILNSNNSKKELKEILESDEDIKDMLPEIMSADLALVGTLRLMQLANGIFTSDTGEVTVLNTEKLQFLKESLESVLKSNETNKVIIWTIFKPTYDQIAKVCDELGVRYVFLNGLQSKDEKQTSIDSFQNDPVTRVIIANQGAGGTGVNLTAANYEYYYSRGFKLGDQLQSDSRAYRGGQTRKTTCINLVASGSIEEKIVARLAEKAKHAEDILANKEFSREEIFNML